jgi:Fe-S-cluster containining protein
MSATDVNPFGLTKIKRDDLPKGGNLCEYCTAKCCKYFALPIDIPETFEELEYIRWYLLHDRASVFKEDDDWYLLVHTTCEHLLPDNRCGIYETRPKICRDYTTDNCEYDDSWTYDFYLETADQVWEYTEAVLQPKGQSIRSRKPNPLAIV